MKTPGWGGLGPGHDAKAVAAGRRSLAVGEQTRRGDEVVAVLLYSGRGSRVRLL